jgi:hypothetical protein
MNEMFCKSCNKPIKGRTDKKFCNDYCRNVYHNQTKSAQIKTIRNIYNQLLRNRKILHHWYQKTPSPHYVTREQLAMSGFVFRYHTHFIKDIPMCFDYGLLEYNNQGMCIVNGLMSALANFHPSVLNEDMLTD